MSFIDDEVARGSEPTTRAAYEAALLFYMERDGFVVPMLAECPAARALVAVGKARWVGPLRLEPPESP